MKPEKIIATLIEEFGSVAGFARKINEDKADVTRWRDGKMKVKPRGVVAICRHYPQYRPHDLNPEIFPADLTFKFGE